jgi:hypothetical protein
MLTFIEKPHARRVNRKSASRPAQPLPPLVSPNYPLRHARADDSLVERVKFIAVKHFIAVLGSSADHQAPFKSLITIDIEGKHMRLLLTGTAHGVVEDGSIIAVLNPDQELVDKLSGGWGCNSAIFREAVAKKCDLALNIWVDAYKPNGVCLITQYVSREPRPDAGLVR